MSRTQHARSHRMKRPPMCAHHRPSKTKGFAGHAEMKACADRGEQPKQCPDCRFWFWPHEYGEPVAPAKTLDERLAAVFADGRQHELQVYAHHGVERIYVDGRYLGERKT
jgi:hypothetical protein